MDNRNIFAENLNKYLAESGKSRKEVCEALGFNYFTFTSWVNGSKYPRMDKVELLASYFGCKKSDLIEDKKEKPAEDNGELSAKKRAFIERVKQMSEEELERLEQILRIVESTK